MAYYINYVPIKFLRPRILLNGILKHFATMRKSGMDNPLLISVHKTFYQEMIVEYVDR